MRLAILRSILCSVLAWHCATQAQGTTVVRMPRPESPLDERTQFAATVLREALQRSGASYRVEQHPVRMQQGRALLRLQTGQGIDVVCTMTSREREEMHQPVRIPLDKGLLGWRLMLVKQSDVARFGEVRTLGDLRQHVAGQGVDWPDMAILRASGLPVYGTSNYASLFNMLSTGRIDYFPRAVTEVWREQRFYNASLAVAPNVVLRYPAALYFFVRKGNDRLAGHITRGMESMLADGTFDAMFQKEYGEAIRLSQLGRRHVIDMDNPVLPAYLPLERKALWYREKFGN